MNAHDLISVIVPVYNVETYLERCLSSISMQTFKNLQVILINDGSNDLSGEICDEFVKKDCRFEVVHQEHQGVSNARNKGLMRSKGKYIGFVDADDWLEYDYYERMLETINMYQSQIVRCNYWCCYSENKKSLFAGITRQVQILDGRDAIFNSIKYKTRHSYGNTIWNSLFEREVVYEPNIILFNENLSIGEDWDWIANVFMRCNKVVLLPESYYYYNCMNLKSATRNLSNAQKKMSVRNTVSFLERNDFDKKIIDSRRCRLDKYDSYEEVLHYIEHDKINFKVLCNGLHLFKSDAVFFAKCKHLLLISLVLFHFPRVIVDKIYRMY